MAPENPTTSTVESNGTTSSARPAKLHGRAFYESIGSPKYVLAPMVDQSEFAWRMLSRSFLSPSEQSNLLAYTPMLHARLFKDTEKYRKSHFEPTRQSQSDSPPAPYLDGNPAIDRPLFVQFCANEPDVLLDAAKKVAPYCDAVDLNLGCPQGIAKRGHYGAFLQEDQALVYKLINDLHNSLPVPVTAKIRILDTKEATLAYAKNVLAAGASILTVHGRRREQKGHITGLADWSVIKYLRESLPPETVLFANGNVLQHGDLEKCLEATGADAVMSAEGNLSDPAIFTRPPEIGQEGREYWRGKDGKGGWRVDAMMRRYLDILYKYILDAEPPSRRPLFVPGDDTSWMDDSAADAEAEEPQRKRQRKDGGGKKSQPSSPNFVATQPHMFNLLRHLVSKHTDIRDILARTKGGDMASYEKLLTMVEHRIAGGLIEYEKTGGQSVDEPSDKVLTGIEPSVGEAGKKESDAEVNDAESSVATVKNCKRPWWVAQPIVRPLPKEALAKGAISLSKKEQGLKKEARDQAHTSDAAAAQDIQKDVQDRVLAMDDKLLAG